MSFASAMLKGFYTTPFGSGGEWSGWRKVLTTDAYGNLTAGQNPAIYNMVIGDTYSIELSGPIIPDTALISASLSVDTQAGTSVFSLDGQLEADGEAGAYDLQFIILPALTGLLRTTHYTWSVRVATAAGDVWTPILKQQLVNPH